NLDNEETRLLADQAGELFSFGIEHPEAMVGIEPGTIEETPTGIAALLVDRRDDVGHALRIAMPGRHNLANALAAVAGAAAAGVPVEQAVLALHGFSGLARRFDVIGTSPSGVTVIDDFGHNPDKCR